MPTEHHLLREMTPLRRNLEYVVRVLVFHSIISYFLELEFSDSVCSEGFWLWNERFIALFFTLEYAVRWAYSDHKKHYPFKLLSVIDFISILPFYVGFFVPLGVLDVIRTLRILRLLKLIRYSPALCNIIHSLGKVRNELLMVGYVVVMVLLFSSALMYQFEKDHQPDKFSRPSDSVWWCFVTLTTVGYGDLAPVSFGGRVVAICTMVVGLGIFGIFISLIGGAFVASMKESYEQGTDRDLQQEAGGEGSGGRPPVQEEAPLGTGRDRRQE